MKPNIDADPKARGISVLDEYAMGRWECVLHFMVGSHQHEAISSDALQILQHAGLMKKYTYIQILCKTAVINISYLGNLGKTS